MSGAANLGDIINIAIVLIRKTFKNSKILKKKIEKMF